MANIDNLSIPSLSSLDAEDGLSLILAMRERRKYIAPKPVRKSKTVESGIAKMSEAQLKELYYALANKMQKELPL